MAGLLAWAADVVGGHGKEHDADSIPLIFTPEQQKYVQELNQKASSLSLSIQDLRLRLSPPDISQRLPHLLAHSLASNAALALQLNSHSATREQAQLREETLQEENAVYEKAISNCESKIQEKMLEADSLRTKLKELDAIEKTLRADLENGRAAVNVNQPGSSGELVVESNANITAGADSEASQSAILDKLENKKQELSYIEERVQDLEKKWAIVQDKALKHPSPAQREKTLDKQLHSLIEQLAAKQSQAEGLTSEIHLKEKELERLNGLWSRLKSSNIEANTARNRFGRSTSEKGSVSDYLVNLHHKPLHNAGDRNENQNRHMLLRSAFVIYILALNILVFIKISF
ncbi:uncharacterized protein LOC110807232 [Carica papaya]|uniref:uncharacterized protein LOC110807232 n=1 Tax=Carica papaya TaxID=3649 RepID=UPI000B8C8678|nr:uncharacterized protein LOC110807232 [Carica papaya]